MQPVPRLGPRTKDRKSKGHEFESSLAKGNNSENTNLHTLRCEDASKKKTSILSGALKFHFFRDKKGFESEMEG